MTEPRRFTVFDFLLFVAVLLLAAALRIGYVVCCTDDKHPQGSLFVQDLLPSSANPTPAVPEKRDLHELVDNICFDNGFISKAPFAEKPEPTAHTAPGFPVLVGLLARVADPWAPASWLQWIQVAVGTLTAGLYFLFARRAFGSSAVALVAGVLTAVYPFWIINTAAVNDGTLAAFLLALVLFLGVRAGQSGGAFSSLLFGLMLAALALTRAYYLPFALVALAWFLLRSRLLNAGWLCAVVAFLGFVLGLAPWTVRNYNLFHEPVPVADTTYYHLWIGNNPEANGGPVTPKMVEKAEKQLNTGHLKLAELEQQERYSRLGTIVRDTVQNDTVDVVNWRIRAALDFFLGESFFEHGVFVEKMPESAPKDAEESAKSFSSEVKATLNNSIHGILAVTMALLLGLGVLGWRWTYGFARDSMPAALAIIWIPLPYILTHAEALHGPRLPLDGVLLCYVAFALCCFVPFLGGYLFAGSPPVKVERV
jgi:Dolichyl-phosphate-mannose-protein mannosyltransferase